jgi:hypothetical protein
MSKIDASLLMEDGWDFAMAIKIVNWVDRMHVSLNASSYMRVIARAVRRKLNDAQ